MDIFLTISAMARHSWSRTWTNRRALGSRNAEAIHPHRTQSHCTGWSSTSIGPSPSHWPRLVLSPCLSGPMPPAPSQLAKGTASARIDHQIRGRIWQAYSIHLPTVYRFNQCMRKKTSGKKCPIILSTAFEQSAKAQWINQNTENFIRSCNPWLGVWSNHITVRESSKM
jgi:hypothetical protein